MPSSVTSLALTYLDALRQGDRQRAGRLVLDAVAAGTSVKDIYLGVFQPAQYEVGRLWERNEISVA
ncbi:MAG: B12-binding domain-containing protein [Acidobacteria bacterium]|nr:B12-binding domain-containing protein [Acidobacteriota bacterium]